MWQWLQVLQTDSLQRLPPFCGIGRWKCSHLRIIAQKKLPSWDCLCRRHQIPWGPSPWPCSWFLAESFLSQCFASRLGTWWACWFLAWVFLPPPADRHAVWQSCKLFAAPLKGCQASKSHAFAASRAGWLPSRIDLQQDSGIARGNAITPARCLVRVTSPPPKSFWVAGLGYWLPSALQAAQSRKSLLSFGALASAQCLLEPFSSPKIRQLWRS